VFPSITVSDTASTQAHPLNAVRLLKWLTK